MTRRIAGLLSLLVVAACSPLSFATSDAPTLYELTPKSTFDPIPKNDLRLGIEIPTARAGLNTAKIALRPTPTGLDYYAGSLWAAVVPNMVQTLVSESFSNAKGIELAGESAGNARADVTLGLQIREFQAEYQDIKKPPMIHVAIQAVLAKAPRGAVIGNEKFSAKVRAAGTQVPDIVEAYDDALGKVLKRLVNWTAHQMTDQEP